MLLEHPGIWANYQGLSVYNPRVYFLFYNANPRLKRLAPIVTVNMLGVHKEYVRTNDMLITDLKIYLALCSLSDLPIGSMQSWFLYLTTRHQTYSYH